VCYSRRMVYAYVQNFVSIGLFCRLLLTKNPNFCRFWISAFSVVASWQQSKQLNRGAQLQTFPYPTASKSFLFLYSNAFIVKSAAQSLTFKSVTSKQTNRETNRQKTQRFWPHRRRVKSEPNQTWHGDRRPRARSCTSKTFGVLTHSFATRWQ